MSARVRYFDTPYSWDKGRNVFRRYASEFTALSRVLKITRRDRSNSHFDMQPVVRDLLIGERNLFFTCRGKH